MRTADVAMAIPQILFALVCVAAFGASLVSLTVIAGLLLSPSSARMARAVVIQEMALDYYAAAVACGTGRARLMLTEVLPNVAPALGSQAVINAASAIILEASLSFVGLGVQPPQMSWGGLLQQGYAFLYSDPSYAVGPARVHPADRVVLEPGRGPSRRSQPAGTGESTMTSQRSGLDVTDLRVNVGSTPIVRGVSFALRPGARLGLVGESGSGKSLTALSIMGLVRPPLRVTGGQVRLGDVDLRALRRKELDRVRGRRISMIYQDPMASLNPLMTVGDQIAEAVLLHTDVSRAVARERAVELLGEVGVPLARTRLRAYPHEFSGGMLQRVMIAIALAGDPDVLLCDEPTTALDVTTQIRIINLLDRSARLPAWRPSDHPRSRGRGRLLRRHRGDVRRADRGARTHAGPVRSATAPVQPGVDVRRHRLRHRPRPSGAGDRRPAAGAGRHRPWLRVPAAMPTGDRVVRRRRAGAA